MNVSHPFLHSHVATWIFQLPEYVGFMKAISLVSCAVAGLFLAACGKSSPSADSNNNSPLTAPVDYLNSAAKSEQSAVKTIDTTSVTEAIQLFYTDKGRFPKDLQELVTEKYLPLVPTPPFGTRLDYDPATGAVKVVKE
jgi:hypothetical protein